MRRAYTTSSRRHPRQRPDIAVLAPSITQCGSRKRGYVRQARCHACVCGGECGVVKIVKRAGSVVCGSVKMKMRVRGQCVAVKIADADMFDVLRGCPTTRLHFSVERRRPCLPPRPMRCVPAHLSTAMMASAAARAPSPPIATCHGKSHCFATFISRVTLKVIDRVLQEYCAVGEQPPYAISHIRYSQRLRKLFTRERLKADCHAHHERSQPRAMSSRQAFIFHYADRSTRRRNHRTTNRNRATPQFGTIRNRRVCRRRSNRQNRSIVVPGRNALRQPPHHNHLYRPPPPPSAEMKETALLQNHV